MEFDELISAFADHHGLTSLSPVDNAVALDVDNMVVSVISDGSTVTMSSDIGEPPVEGKATFADLLLQANLQSQVFFAKLSDVGVYVAMRQLALRDADVESFDAALESLVNAVETWRRILEDYRPASEAAASKAATDDTISKLSGGFMSV